MNLQRKGFLSLLIMMIIGAFAFVACDDDNVEKPKVITEVSLDKTQLTLTEGESATLLATLTPKESKEAISWSSDNAKVATVSQSGEVKAVAEGSATITASLKNGKKATCKVTVTKKQAEEKTTISLDKASATLKVGETLELVTTLAPENAKDEVTYSSSKEEVAKVDDKGVVTAVAEGEAVITASLENGSKATCTITVTKKEEEPAPTPTPGTGEHATVKFKQETYTINVGETKNFKSEVLIMMGKDPNEDVTLKFSTFEDNIISVTQDGSVKGLQAGEAELLVELKNFELAFCNITVVGEGGGGNDDPTPTPPANKEVRISPTSLNMMEGDQILLTIQYLGGLTPEEVTLKSQNTDIVTVTNEGLVNAKKAGETSIQVYINGVPQHHYISVKVNEVVKDGKYSYVIRHIKRDIIAEKDVIDEPVLGEKGKKVIRDVFVPNGSGATNKFFVLVDVTNNETKETERIAPTITLSPDEDDPEDFVSSGIDGSVSYYGSGKFNLNIKMAEFGIDETVKVILTRKKNKE